MQWTETDKRLGMDRGITRRDFLDGIALTIGAAALGGFHARCQRQSKRVPKGNAKCCHFRVCKIAV
jgi:spermidine dehydrogenase